MRAFKTIRDPKAFEILADETRRKIIYLLRAKEMTVSQLAGELGVTPQAVYHQISKLREVGLVDIAREERVDHFIETYYRAAAEVFELQHGEAGSAESEKHYKEAFEALSKVGMTVSADPEVARKVAQVHAGLDKLGLPADLEEKIAQLDDVGFFTKSKMHEIAQMALMTGKQFDQMVSSWKALRKLMTSNVTKKERRRAESGK